jgi:mono/diheme cytochrome c family protein
MHVPASTRPVLLSLTLMTLFAPSVFAAAPPSSDLPTRARAVLQRSCFTCHGDSARPKGGLGRITDLQKLIAQGQVVPGKPLESPLYQRIADGEMPPTGKRGRFNPSDGALIRSWILAGAPTGQPSAARLLTESDALGLVRSDLQSRPARQRRFFRYLTLGHLATQPASLQQDARDAVAKLANSLSWHPRLTVPSAIDPGRLVYRFDLRHYRWTARQWDKLAATYPYRPAEPGPLARQVALLAGCDQPLLRGDWFVATASRPPFYHDFLQLPNSDRALERLLQVDVPENIEDDNAVRAGFNGSGVARSNRVLERHDALHGAYWRSYDFNDNTNRGNLFEYPLGPAPGPAGFRHAGGEIIFHLPNGLQGYLLVDADGRRIDRAPGEIVSDPKRPDKIVENGLSCLTCHVQGIIPKDDQVRGHVQKNPRAFTAEQRTSILALYAPAARLRALVKEDNERFSAALKRLAIKVREPEPVVAVVQRFEEVLDLRRAADEVGVSTTDLAAVLRRSTELGRSLGPLLSRGSVQRQVFEEAFPRLLGQLPSKANTDNSRLVATGTFRGHRGSVRALAFAPDGKTFASAGEDETVRIWNIESGKSRQLASGLDEPRALAFSPDGRHLLTGGSDRVVLLWEVSTGKRLGRLVGHTAGVRAVAFSADGKQALSAGEDRAVRVWDVDKATPIRTMTGHRGTITGLAIFGEGRFVLSAATDRTVRMWRLADGKLLSRWDQGGEVYAVAVSVDGKRVFSAGSDRAVSVRAIGGTAARGLPLTGHPGTVVSVAPIADGSLLSASVHSETREHALRRWDLSTRRGQTVGPPGPVEAAVVSSDGRALLAQAGVIHLVSGMR